MSRQKKRIDGEVYQVTPFQGREAFKIQMKLARLIAPLVGLMAGMFSGMDLKKIEKLSELDIDIDGESLSKVLDALFSKYSDEELLDLLILLFEKVEKGEDDKKIFITAEAFDTIFAQNLVTAFKVAFFVIQVNYPDFFGLAALIGKETTEING
ncbi:MAG: hypothetical protein PQJ58_15205 [Spirochaetales bacterium]|nr:hypothetical protein [Spirochaetales bacterium]